MAQVAVTLSILGSGSRGNAAVLASARTRILIDAGFSRRELIRRMALAGYAPEQLSAILVTHEHSDHVAGLAKLAAVCPAPVLLNDATRAALGPAADTLPSREAFTTGVPFTLGDIEVTPFALPHDAADPVGFSFRAEGVRLVFVTDLGYLTANVKHQLRAADCLVLESNHDLDLLKSGGYPWEVKQRIMGRLGHLSNDTVAEFLRTDFDGACAHLVLAHLSDNNNLPGLALIAAQRALAPRARRPQLHVAAQAAPTPALCF
jgi:phosphoribosyl 1,2-cyclic phosphodiesterase